MNLKKKNKRLALNDCEVEAEGSALAWRELAGQCGGAAFLSTRFLIFILICL